MNKDFPRVIDQQAVDKTILAQAIKKEFGLSVESYCERKSVTFLTACLQFNTSPEQLSASLAQAATFRIKISNRSSNAWQLALLVDQLMPFAKDHQAQLHPLLDKLGQALHTHLDLLDRGGASLWHARFSLACSAFMLGVITAEQNPVALQRAYRHFMDSVLALETTEAWPNGYHYWINNRALPFLLAAASYLQGTQGKHKQRLLALIERIGLWQIYMTRPDHRIEAIGDEGSRVDLKDESRKVMDLIAKLTRNPVFASYSQYLQQLHGRESYHRSYRWMPALFYDPTLGPNADSFSDLSMFDGVLPTTEVFGRGAYNQVVMRSGWSKDDSFIQIRGGHHFNHHQHYDAGHFSVFYQTPVIVDAAVYHDNYFKASRLNFSIRSVAKNTLLLPLPGEVVKPNRFFVQNVNPGGQRIVQPTGSVVTSVKDWRNKPGKYQGGALLRQQAQEGVFSFVEFDLTLGYQTQVAKAQKIIRRLLFLPQSQQVLVLDTLTGVKHNIRAKSQLHLKYPPQVSTQVSTQAVSGAQVETGIVAFKQQGQLPLIGHQASIGLLLPEQSRNLVYSGEKNRFMVESFENSGPIFVDQRADYSNQSWFDNPLYRLERQQLKHASTQEFVTALSLEKTVAAKLTISNGDFRAYQLADNLIIDLLSSPLEVQVSLQGIAHIFVLGPASQKSLTVHGTAQTLIVPLAQGIGFYDN